MAPTPDKIQIILGVGGSVVVDAKTIHPDKLQIMASVAKNSGGTLTIKNASSIHPDKAQIIAGVGKASVILDFTG